MNKRAQIDRCADYILKTEEKNFKKNPSSAHVYMDAYSVIFGHAEAYKMLEKARK